MKFIIYRGQKKITIDNAMVPNFNSFESLMDDLNLSNFILADLQLYDVKITSTRGMVLEDEEIDNEEIEKEVSEGINWVQETVN